MAKNAQSKTRRQQRELLDGDNVRGMTGRHGKANKSPAVMRAEEHWLRPEERQHLYQALTYKTQAQANYRQLLESKTVVVSEGPAGTGKTLVATNYACQLLHDRRISKIIITRPAVTSDEDLGLLPGEIIDKFAPFFKPVRDYLESYFGRGAVECMIKNERITIAPIAYLRGSTFTNAFVIVDEAQNVTVSQMQLILTRIGKNCTLVLDGDLDQVDIKDRQGNRLPSGLADAMEILGGLPDFGMQSFTIKDVVRSGMCREITMRYYDRLQLRKQQEQEQ